MCISSYTFSVIIHVKNSAKFKVMGYYVSTPSERRVVIMDPRDDLDEDAATHIVAYLFEEGFIDESEEISCEIVSH